MLSEESLSPSTGGHNTLRLLVRMVGSLFYSSICKRHLFPSPACCVLLQGQAGLWDATASEPVVVHRTMWSCPHVWFP